MKANDAASTRNRLEVGAERAFGWLLGSSGAKKQWPPYELIEDTIETTARAKLDKLERLYHKGQDLAWDGREVLNALVEKHGRPRIPEDKKESALILLGLLMWGELAAWAISADLAERIDDVEAKMAATSQAHDEARHFYVLRDYVRLLGEPLPRLGGVGRKLLIDVLETDSLVHKLIGMQLMVESNALAIFRSLVNAELEPVLTDLLAYYERDEARHVALGVLYLPRLLSKLSRFEAARAQAFQLRCVGLLISGGLPLRPHLVRLGIDPRKMAERVVKLQGEVFDQMRATAKEEESGWLRGVLNPAAGAGPNLLDFVHPVGGIEAAPPVHRAILRAWARGARFADRALA
ncbi:MAG: ferritin-like domain-containing protein [Myxococcales bacterium]|nr:ferritin-like domain-containing protein [Myxococcales bacterium]